MLTFSTHSVDRRSHHPILVLALFGMLFSTACATRLDLLPDHTRAQADDGRHLRFDEVAIVARPEAMAFRELGDAELFATGQEALKEKEYERALMAFEVLASERADSPYRNAALFEAGMALTHLEDHSGAADYFLKAAIEYGSTARGIEAALKAADAFWHLDETQKSLQILEKVSADELAPPMKRVEAEVKRAVLLLEQGKPRESERLLRASVKRLQEELADEPEARALQSRAQYQLAEVFRFDFLKAELNPATSTQEKLHADLEYKAQMLLNAQGHYLRCIRLGHAEWATASGFRIGELYQSFHRQLEGAELPAHLSPDQVKLYQEEVRGKIHVLLEKAVTGYERTLRTARRVGAQNPFVAEAEIQLEKLQELLEEAKASKVREEKVDEESETGDGESQEPRIDAAGLQLPALQQSGPGTSNRE